MGRLFVIELEGPVYKCKECQTDLACPKDFVFNEHLELDGSIYWFIKLFNSFMVAGSLPHVDDIFCVCCCASIGCYYISPADFVLSYFRVLRSKLHGPEGSDDEV